MSCSTGDECVRDEVSVSRSVCARANVPGRGSACHLIATHSFLLLLSLYLGGVLHCPARAQARGNTRVIPRGILKCRKDAFSRASARYVAPVFLLFDVAAGVLGRLEKTSIRIRAPADGLSLRDDVTLRRLARNIETFLESMNMILDACNSRF